MDAIDIILVTYNAPGSLRELVGRLYRLTIRPFRLIVVDNASGSEVRTFLGSLAKRRDNVELILNSENLFCCHATNQALARCTAPWIAYLCSRECYPLWRGWELPCIDFMKANRGAGIAGSVVRTRNFSVGPSYLRRVFSLFRNREWIAEHGPRPFTHVQGGFYILRKRMLDEIGAFNPLLRHNFMDVEYSFYAKSCGWQIGDIPEARSRHAHVPDRFDPSVSVCHPLTPQRLRDFDYLDYLGL